MSPIVSGDTSVYWLSLRSVEELEGEESPKAEWEVVIMLNNYVTNMFLGHVAYLSMLMVEVYHTHPVWRTFVQLLYQTRVNRLGHDNAGLISIRFDFIQYY